MLLNDPHLSKLQTQVFDNFMELDGETQELEKKPPVTETFTREGPSKNTSIKKA